MPTNNNFPVLQSRKRPRGRGEQQGAHQKIIRHDHEPSTDEEKSRQQQQQQQQQHSTSSSSAEAGNNNNNNNNNWGGDVLVGMPRHHRRSRRSTQQQEYHHDYSYLNNRRRQRDLKWSTTTTTSTGDNATRRIRSNTKTTTKKKNNNDENNDDENANSTTTTTSAAAAAAAEGTAVAGNNNNKKNFILGKDTTGENSSTTTTSATKEELININNININNSINNNNATLTAMIRAIDGMSVQEAAMWLRDSSSTINNNRIDKMKGSTATATSTGATNSLLPPQPQSASNYYSPSPPSSSFYYSYPTSTTIVVVIHLVFLAQLYYLKSARSRRRQQRRSSSSVVSYQKLVRDKQFYRLWLPLLSHPFAQQIITIPSTTTTQQSSQSSSSTDNIADHRNGDITTATTTPSSTNNTTLPMGSEDANDIQRRLQNRRYYTREGSNVNNGSSYYSRMVEWYRWMVDLTRRVWNLAMSQVRGISSGSGSGSSRHRHNISSTIIAAIRSLPLLLYNSHIIWSCRALEGHYYYKYYSSSSSSSWLTYVRVLVSLAVMGVGLQLLIVERMNKVAQALRVAVVTSPSSSSSTTTTTTTTGSASPEVRAALEEQGYTNESLKRFQLLVMRYRSVASFTIIPSALTVVFGNVFSHVPLQILPFVTNPSWLLDPALSFVMVFVIEMFLVRFSRSSQSTDGSSGNNSSSNNNSNGTEQESANETAAAAGGANATSTAGSTRSSSGHVDRYGYIHVICGVLSGSFWSVWMDFLADPYWGNGMLILLVLLSLMSVKTNRFWAKYVVCVDYVAMDRHGRIKIPGVDEPQNWIETNLNIGFDGDNINSMVRNMGNDSDHDSSSSDDDDDNDADHNDSSHSPAANAAIEQRDSSTVDDEVQRAYPRLDDEEIYGLVPEMGNMEIDDGDNSGNHTDSESLLASSSASVRRAGRSRTYVRSRRGGSH